MPKSSKKKASETIKIDAIAGAKVSEFDIQEISQAIGGVAYRDRLTGKMFMLRDVDDGATLNKTWATADSDWVLYNMKDLYHKIKEGSTLKTRIISGMIAIKNSETGKITLNDDEICVGGSLYTTQSSLTFRIDGLVFPNFEFDKTIQVSPWFQELSFRNNSISNTLYVTYNFVVMKTSKY